MHGAHDPPSVGKDVLLQTHRCAPSMTRSTLPDDEHGSGQVDGSPLPHAPSRQLDCTSGVSLAQKLGEERQCPTHTRASTKTIIIIVNFRLASTVRVGK